MLSMAGHWLSHLHRDLETGKIPQGKGYNHTLCGGARPGDELWTVFDAIRPSLNYVSEHQTCGVLFHQKHTGDESFQTNLKLELFCFLRIFSCWPLRMFIKPFCSNPNNYKEVALKYNTKIPVCNILLHLCYAR